MPLIRQCLATLGALLVTSQGFASPLECPPVALVAHAKFVEATHDYHDTPEIWGLASKQFQYQGRQWRVMFSANLPEATCETDALDQGAHFFANNVVFKEPYRVPAGDNTMCIYSQENAGYMITALDEYDVNRHMEIMV